MKKILSIALIAALVVGSAFAGFSKGEATISLGYDLDTEDYGFANGKAVEYKFGFVLGEETASNAGEGDFRAEIEAKFKAEIKTKTFTLDDKTVTSPVVSTLKISKANIIYKDVTFGILNAGESADFAASYYDDDEDGDADVDVITGLTGVPGFTAKYSNISGGFGLKGNTASEDFALLSYATVSDLALAEGMTADVAAAAKLEVVAGGDLAYTIQANGAIAYAKDAFSTDAAVDFKLADKAAVEVAANATYDFVNASVYFYALDNFDVLNLDAIVAASKAVSETVTVGGYVETRDVTNDAREVYVGANVKAVVSPVTVEAKASYEVFGKTVAAEAKATYAADAYSAYAKFATEMSFDGDFEMTKIAPEVGVSSSTIVSGATLSLAWTGADFAESADLKGAIKATAKISL